MPDRFVDPAKIGQHPADGVMSVGVRGILPEGLFGMLQCCLMLVEMCKGRRKVGADARVAGLESLRFLEMLPGSCVVGTPHVMNAKAMQYAGHLGIALHRTIKHFEGQVRLAVLLISGTQKSQVVCVRGVVFNSDGVVRDRLGRRSHPQAQVSQLDIERNVVRGLRRHFVIGEQGIRLPSARQFPGRLLARAISCCVVAVLTVGHPECA